MGVGMALFVRTIMQRSEVEIICNHMLGRVIISCEALHGDSTIVLTLDDDSLIEISGEALSVYGELTPMDD
jgi:hypothetical protein